MSRRQPGQVVCGVSATSRSLFCGSVTAPFVWPVLSPEHFIRYAAALGLTGTKLERHESSPLPQHYADQFGWRELVQRVEGAAASLSEQELEQAAIFTANYGEASAILLLGGDLPPVYSGHNQFWLWGPPRRDVRVVITVGIAAERLAPLCAAVEEHGRLEHPYAMPYERAHPVMVCRGGRESLDAMWPRLKHYD